MKRIRLRATSHLLPYVVASDLVAIVLGYVAAFLVRASNLMPGMLPVQYAVGIAILGASLWIVSLAGYGSYRQSTVSSGLLDATSATKATALAFLLMGSVSYVLNAQFSRALILVSYPTGLLFIVIGRRLIRKYWHATISSGAPSNRALFVTRNAEASEIDEIIKTSPDIVMQLQHIFEVTPERIGDDSVVDCILITINEQQANIVVLDQNLGFSAQTMGRLSWELDKRGVELLASPSFLGSWSGRLNIERHPTLPLVQLSEPRLQPLDYVMKRIFDFVVTLPLVIIALPAMVITAIAIKLTSRGPVFFVQPRVGVDGKLFKFYKFRSMYDGADAKRQEVLGRPDEDMPERYKTDPRITPVGRFIRRWSIDEVPQLFHVLLGDMSLVGPRPMLVEEMSQLTEDQARRRLVKPGVTGLWQISGRKDTTWEERMALDLQYIDKWSIGLDLVIVLRTTQVILTGKGSY